MSAKAVAIHTAFAKHTSTRLGDSAMTAVAASIPTSEFRAMTENLNPVETK